MEKASSCIDKLIDERAVKINGHIYLAHNDMCALFSSYDRKEAIALVREIIKCCIENRRTKDKLMLRVVTPSEIKKYYTLLGMRYIFAKADRAKIKSGVLEYFFQCGDGGDNSVHSAEDFIAAEKLRSRNISLWEEWSRDASDFYKFQMDQLRPEQTRSKEEAAIMVDIHRDDSFRKNGKQEKSNSHIMYKCGKTLVSPDGKRGYEFLIEYDIYEPNTGIYYGCKMLTLEGNHNENIDKCRGEWVNVKETMCGFLQDTFPNKNYEARLKTTDNANDDTFWPFWIRLNEEEDIIRVGARAVRIIRNVFKAMLSLEDAGDFKSVGAVNDDRKRAEKIHPLPKENLETCYTREHYFKLIDILRGKAEKEKIDILLKNLEEDGSISRNEKYEYAYQIKEGARKFVTYVFWQYIFNCGEQCEKENRKRFCDCMSRIFIHNHGPQEDHNQEKRKKRKKEISDHISQGHNLENVGEDLRKLF